MNKRKEILETAKFILSLEERVDIDAVRLILAHKNISVSKGYIQQVLCCNKKKEIDKNELFRESAVFSQKEIFAQRRAEIAKLTREGWNLQMIADKYEISRQAVSLLLKKAALEGHVVVKSKRINSDANEKNVVLVRRVRKRDPKICEQCGKEFFHATHKKNCSAECLEKSILKRSGGKWSRKEFVELRCLTCDKVFKRTKYLHQITMKKKENDTNNYCSRSCYHISRTNPVQGF
jgi:hypothetical protein